MQILRKFLGGMRGALLSRRAPLVVRRKYKKPLRTERFFVFDSSNQLNLEWLILIPGPIVEAITQLLMY